MSRLDKFVEYARDPKAATWIADGPYWEIDKTYGYAAADPAIDLAQAIQTKSVEEALCLDLTA